MVGLAAPSSCLTRGTLLCAEVEDTTDGERSSIWTFGRGDHSGAQPQRKPGLRDLVVKARMCFPVSSFCSPWRNQSLGEGWGAGSQWQTSAKVLSELWWEVQRRAHQAQRLVCPGGSGEMTVKWG